MGEKFVQEVSANFSGTYQVMCDTPFYNLRDPNGEKISLNLTKGETIVLKHTGAVKNKKPGEPPIQLYSLKREGQDSYVIIAITDILFAVEDGVLEILRR